LGLEREFSSDELGLTDKNMKSATTYAGNVVCVDGFKDFFASFIVDNTGGGAAGLAKLVVDLYDSTGTAILTSFDLVTSMSTKADNTVSVAFGRSNTAKLHYTSGTPSLSSSADILRCGARMKLSITVTEANNGTTCIASVRMRALA
jgi:hypothetical protein